jgi:glycosyltransferase involved in cell wall biosynthesis
VTEVIAFDGSILAAGPITGVAGSFLTTLTHYAQMTPYECILLTPKDGTDIAVPGVANFPCLTPGRWRRLRALGKGCHATRAALLHSPVTAIPRRNPCPTIATVHDLPWLYPELRGEPGSRLLRRLAVHLAARTAAAIIVPSQSTLTDLRRFARVTDENVHVIHHGVVNPHEPAPAEQLTGPFLVLGDDRPRKNLSRIRRAHAKAVEQDATIPGLRFVGPGHGYVEESEKVAILRRARALMHVSLLEGFGLPVLEAFAHGVPVICSDTTSLPEVARDAALQVDPTDEDSVAAAIVRVHRDAELRGQLRRRGLQRAAELTPDVSAGKWLALHRSLLSG